jgi:hypothetical protein
MPARPAAAPAKKNRMGLFVGLLVTVIAAGAGVVWFMNDGKFF